MNPTVAAVCVTLHVCFPNVIRTMIKNWIIGYFNSRFLIGLGIFSLRVSSRLELVGYEKYITNSYLTGASGVITKKYPRLDKRGWDFRTVPYYFTQIVDMNRVQTCIHNKWIGAVQKTYPNEVWYYHFYQRQATCTGRNKDFQFWKESGQEKLKSSYWRLDCDHFL